MGIIKKYKVLKNVIKKVKNIQKIFIKKRKNDENLVILRRYYLI